MVCGNIILADATTAVVIIHIAVADLSLRFKQAFFGSGDYAARLVICD